MIKNLLCTAVVLLSATALRADVFSFSYSGTFVLSSVSLTGTVTATAGSGGTYNVTAVSGTRKVTTFGVTQTSSVSDGSSWLFSDNFSLVGGSPSGTLYLNLSGSAGTGLDIFNFAPGNGNDNESGLVVFSSGNAVITRAPEPAVLSLLLTMGLGVWLFARKLPSRKTPIS